MFCSNCGNQLTESHRFCQKCGAPNPENSASIPSGQKKTKPWLIFAISGAVFFIGVLVVCIVMLVRVGNVNKELAAMEAERTEAQNAEDIEDVIDAMFEDRSSSVRGNEDLGSACLNYICQQTIYAADDFLTDKLGFEIEGSAFGTIELDQTIFDQFMNFFQNEENYNKVTTAITGRSAIVYDNIEIDGDTAYAEITVKHIDIYEICFLTWESFFNTSNAVDILLGGEIAALGELAKLVSGDLSIFLDDFSDNCTIVKNDSTYTDKVKLALNDDGNWEIVDFPIELLYAYYGISPDSLDD